MIDLVKFLSLDTSFFNAELREKVRLKKNQTRQGRNLSYIRTYIFNRIQIPRLCLLNEKLSVI